MKRSYQSSIPYGRKLLCGIPKIYFGNCSLLCKKPANVGKAHEISKVARVSIKLHHSITMHFSPIELLVLSNVQSIALVYNKGLDHSCPHFYKNIFLSWASVRRRIIERERNILRRKIRKSRRFDYNSTSPILVSTRCSSAKYVV